MKQHLVSALKPLLRLSVQLNKSHRLLLPATIFSLSLLTACQKADDNNAQQQTQLNSDATTSSAMSHNEQSLDSTNPSNSDENNASNDSLDSGNDNSSENNSAAGDNTDSTAPEIQVSSTEDIIAPNISAPITASQSQPPPQPDPSVAIIGTQISTVDYTGAEGEKLQVIYETSSSGELQAIAMLQTGERISMSAPSGQGNNPTYSSADGEIKIVSHGGGGSVDLIHNGTITDFKAVNAEAEVISNQP